MSGMLRAAFTGYYGMGNFGDDLFGIVCARAAREFWNAEPLLVGPKLAGAAAASTMPDGFPAALYGAPGPIGKAARLYSFALGLRRADVLTMGGGSVIAGRASFRKPMMLAAQRRGRLRLAAIGVSIGPFADAPAEKAAAELVRRFDYVAVRDRRSYEWLSRMGLAERAHHGRDLAGLLPLLAKAMSEQATPPRWNARVVGVAPCRYAVRSDHPAPDPDAWQGPLVEALAAQARRGPLQVQVFSLNRHPHHGDAALAEALTQRLLARGLEVVRANYGELDVLATVRAIARCDAFISARLHGAVVAYLCGVPFAMIDYHPKCRDFCDDIGLPTVARIGGSQYDTDAFSDALAAMLNGDALPAVSSDLYAQQARRVFQCAPWAIRTPA